jgi:hypothetical protein
MSAIQARFEVAVPELPAHIEPSTYSKPSLSSSSALLIIPISDLLKTLSPLTEYAPRVVYITVSSCVAQAVPYVFPSITLDAPTSE